MRSFLTTSLIAAALISATARGDGKEPHLDIWLRPVDGAVMTGAITEGTPGKPVADRADVFAGEFGTDPKFPFAAFEPGFQALATGFVTSFSFEIAGPVLRFDGADFAPTAVTMTLAYGPSSTTSTSGTASGFAFNTFADGLLHDHFDYILNGVAGADPESGVYALPLRFSAISPAADAGNVAWVVLNAGEAESMHDAAILRAELYLACGIDATGDGTVNAEDLAELLGAWGSGDAAVDYDRSGSVDAQDLSVLLGSWGYTCD